MTLPISLVMPSFNFWILRDGRSPEPPIRWPSHLRQVKLASTGSRSLQKTMEQGALRFFLIGLNPSRPTQPSWWANSCSRTIAMILRAQQCQYGKTVETFFRVHTGWLTWPMGSRLISIPQRTSVPHRSNSQLLPSCCRKNVGNSH